MNHRIVFPARHCAELITETADSAPLAADEVRGSTLTSVLSSGTELGMQFDAPDGFPHHPGYGAVFQVTERGAGVADIGPGDLAFCIGPHAARQRCTRAEIVPVPPGLAPAVAVQARLLAIPWTRLVLAAARPPAPLLVTGLGPIGHLAARLAALLGHPVLAVDPLPERRALLDGFADITVAERIPSGDARWQDRVELVLECSGHEEALYGSCCLARPGAELVVLGVPWRSRSPRPLRDVTWKLFWRHLKLHGGWEWELPWSPTEGRRGNHRDICATALAWLAEGRLDLDGLHRSVDPVDCQAVYDELLAGTAPTLITVFDWAAYV